MPREDSPTPTKTELIEAGREHRPLTSQQDTFARVFARTGNVPLAFAEAGYKVAATPEKTAQRSYRLMCNPLVQERIMHYREKYARALEIKDSRLLAELACVALMDPVEMERDPELERDFLKTEQDQCTYRSLREMPETLRRAISEVIIVHKADGVIERRYKFHDKLKALELIGQIKGVLRNKGAQLTRINVKTSAGEITIATPVRGE